MFVSLCLEDYEKLLCKITIDQEEKIKKVWYKGEHLVKNKKMHVRESNHIFSITSHHVTSLHVTHITSRRV